MGTALLRGYMAGALEKPKPGGAYRVTVRRREKLKPGECPVFTGLENSPIQGVSSPAQISEEGTVAYYFKH